MCNFCPNTMFVDAVPNPQNPNVGTTAVDSFNAPNIINLTLDGANSNCSEPICLTLLYEARIDFILNDTNGGVVLCLETSIDKINWFPFNPQSLINLTENTSTILGLTNGLWYRFCVKADNECHTNTEGTIDINILLKHTT
jgi:hypothetical protein